MWDVRLFCRQKEIKEKIYAAVRDIAKAYGIGINVEWQDAVGKTADIGKHFAYGLLIFQICDIQDMKQLKIWREACPAAYIIGFSEIVGEEKKGV